MKLDKIKATPNYSKRTFTIKKYHNDKLIAKYRTIPMSSEEFEKQEVNTENDWRQFLKTDEYYPVK
jgi:hypothetical protein